MKVAEIIEKKIKSNYDNSVNANNSGMKRLSPETIKRKMRLGASTPSKPLLMTHQLKQATIKKKISNTEAHIFVRDNVRTGGVTNTQILEFQKKYKRVPFGLENSLPEIRKYINGN